MEQLHLSLSNIHCKDCEDTVYNKLSHFFNLVRIHSYPPEDDDIERLKRGTAYFLLSGKGVDLYYNSQESESLLQHSVKKIKKLLTKAGFDVLSWEFYKNGEIEMSSQISTSNNENVDSDDSEGFFDMLDIYSRYKERMAVRSHLKHCKKCRDEKKLNKTTTSDSVSDLSSSIETVVDKPNKEFRAVFAISGMTCAACVHSVSDQIDKLLNLEVEKRTDEPNFSVNLLQHIAVVITPNKQILNTIIDGINDIGFECRLLEVLPVQRSINIKVTAVIDGITCAACANSISSAVNELPFILESGINVVTKTGQFVMEESTKNDHNLEILKQTIEDCGFGFELVSSNKINYASSNKKSRSINLSIKGMFCSHCPELIIEYLSSYGEAVIIQDPITLKHPFIKFTYIPSQDLNIRKLLFDLNHIESTEDGYKINPNMEGNFECTLVEPVSMDEHLRKLSKREILRITRRLVIATIFAIPTFVFGVVAMSLLPKSDKFRQWVEEPIWVGNVSRNTWILLFLSTPVYFFAADIFHRKAIKEIKSLWFYKNSFEKRLFRFGSMNLLMFLGTSVSYFASIVLLILSSKQERHSHMGFHTTYFDSVVFLTFFLLIGRLLESFSKSRTADAIANLSSLKVTRTTVVEQICDKFGNDQTVDVKYLETDDYIRIVSGESPPVDCIVIEGSSEFDESALTGESTPVNHIPGHQIFSGTVNIGNNSIIAKIISLEGNSLIDQIVNTVRDGQLRKAPIERTADLLTGFFVPIIVFLAVITWIIWLSLAYSGALPDHYLDIDIGGWAVWSLEFSIAVFVIACPCGVGLAAPTALFVGSGLAAKYGILAKGGGVAFQDGANTNVVCFDKTGTLTYGELKVTDYSFINANGPDMDSIVITYGLQIARDLELASKHPIAKSVRSFIDNYCLQKHQLQLSQNKIPQVENIPGKGLKGSIVVDSSNDIWNKYKPSEAVLGNESLFKDINVTISPEQQDLLDKWKTECKSIILVGVKCEKLFNDEEFHLLLMMACRDQIRSETKQIINYLQKKKIECWMITGDNKLTAEAIGKEIGMSNIISEVLPDEKQAQIKRIQQIKGNVVGMVGDGINDAPALAAADVGIALSSGADLAVTSSDFILLNKSHPLVTLVTLLDLSRVVFRRVKFNFAWSLVYNVIGIPIAAGVIYPYNNSRLSPVWASAAMAASSISVVMSSLALKFYKPKVKVDEIVKISNSKEDDAEPVEAFVT